jgi:hypothetical protein
MFGSEILDVAVGMVFIFIVVSSICSALREGIEAILKTRASHLEWGIREMLHDQDAKGLAKDFFSHPMIFSLYGGPYAGSRFNAWLPTMLTSGRNLPSYIPARSFALALMDMAARGTSMDAASSGASGAAFTLQDIRANVKNLGSPAVQRILLTAIDTAQGDLNQAISNVEAWYDGTMDRVSGWYKRSTQWILFAIGLFVAIGLNVDTLRIANHLYTNKTARDIVVAQATQKTGSGAAAGQPVSYANAQSALAEMPIPVGPKNWPRRDPADTDPNAERNLWLMSLIGWMMTAMAATLGAPFWFDVLNKITVIRSTVKPHEKSPEEASEDRQASPSSVGAAMPPPPAGPPAL